MHVEPLGETRIPFYLKPFFWNQKRKYGKLLEAALVWARVPRLFAGVATLYGAIDSKHSAVDPALRSLITVRVSQINWCAFCVDINAATLMKRGASEDKVAALSNWRDSNLFSERERVALDYAETVTLSDRKPDPAMMDTVRQHFDGDDLVDLTALIAFQNMSSKFNSALDVQPQGFCRLPVKAGA